MKERNFGLDIIRTISIFLVLMQHAGVGPQGLKLGGVGVEIFFVLSGFLIGEIILKNLYANNSLSTIWKFWIRRWFRILPLYYFVLIIKFALDPSIKGNILYYLFFLQNNFYGIDFFPISWSLVIEEWFYLFVPFFIFIVFKLLSKNKSQALFFSIALFIVAESILRFFWIQYTNRPFSAIIGNFPFRLDSLMIGVFLAHLKMNFSNMYFKLATIKMFSISFFIFLLYLILWNYLLYPINLMDKFTFTRTIWFSLTSLLIMLCVPYIELTFKNGLRFQKYIASFITLTSILTYALYLIHADVFSLILKSTAYSINWFLELFIALLITYTVSFLLYKYLEKPAMDLRERFK